MKIVFIGNRSNVLTELLSNFSPLISVEKIYVLEESPLHKFLLKKNIDFNLFNLSDKESILDALRIEQFDILVSNGCPFILPIRELSDGNKRFINVHPTYLPNLRGKTPVNGVFLYNQNFGGATMHFMDDGIDTGEIIYQEKFPLSPDINLAMLYYACFRLEGEVFKKGFTDYILGRKKLSRKKEGIGSYFNRTAAMQLIDFNDSNETIITKVKAFGIPSQGCISIISNRTLRIYAAEIIDNSQFNKWFYSEITGTLVLELDGTLIIKSREGLIKVTSFDWESR